MTGWSDAAAEALGPAIAGHCCPPTVGGEGGNGWRLRDQREPAAARTARSPTPPQGPSRYRPDRCRGGAVRCRASMT